MEDDGAAEALECGRDLLLRRAAVDDNRRPQPGGKLELPLEDLALPVARRVVAIEVEADLADRDGMLVSEELSQLVEPVCVVVCRLVRVDPERRRDT